MGKITAEHLGLIGIAVGLSFAGYLLWIVVLGPLIFLLAHGR